jgi:succinoglycan biosynthesis transport protein ExoP
MAVTEGDAQPASHLPRLRSDYLDRPVSDWGAMEEESGFRHLFDLVARHRVLFAVLLLGSLIAGLTVAAMMPQRYVARATVLVEGRSPRVINIDPVLDASPPNPFAIDTDMASEAQLILSKKILGPVVERLGVAADPDYSASGIVTAALGRILGEGTPAPDPAKVYEAFAKSVAAKPVGPSRAIEITYLAQDRGRAVEVVNAVADQYAAFSSEQRRSISQTALQSLLSRVEALRSDVADAEDAVERYRAGENLATSTGADVTEQRLVDLNARLVAAQTQVSSLSAQLDAARSAGTSSDSAAAVLSSPVIQQLRVSESTLATQAAELAASLGPAHPRRASNAAALSTIRAKIAAETGKVLTQLESELAAATAEEKAVRRIIADVEGEVASKQRAQVTLRGLAREAEAKRHLYEQFLNRAEEVQHQIGLQTADASVITPADRAKASIERLIPLLGALVIGVAAAFFAVIVKSSLARGYTSLSRLDPVVGGNLIGLLPEVGRKTLARPFEPSREGGAYIEAMQGVRAFLRTIAPAPQVVLFASPLAGEGKTTAALTFARLAALSGQRVLLLEADLRRPRLPGLLGSIGPGLSEILTGKATAKEAAWTEKQSGLDIITAGRLDPALPRLLESTEMENLLRQLRGSYDMVVLDTPPVLAVADARMLARMADYIVYLVRWGSTPRRSARMGIEVLSKISPAYIGVVFSHAGLTAQGAYGYSAARGMSTAGRDMAGASA